MSDSEGAVLPLTVYGANQSFFTRKVTGYLDYKGLPWHLRRGLASSEEARAAGWPGGIPAVIGDDGDVMWDSTSMILHLEHHHPERSVLPEGSLERLGVTPENIDAWMDDALKPWLATLSDHVGSHGYLFGGRPSMADFAFYGGNAAHFVNDPLCWAWVDEVGPEVARHTFRLTNPLDETFGDWLAPGDVPDSLISVLRQAGRHYLPWVAAATVDQAGTIGDPAPRPRPADNRPYPAGA